MFPRRFPAAFLLFLAATGCGSGDKLTTPTAIHTRPTPSEIVTPLATPLMANTGTEYRFSVTASPSCHLPVEIMRRTYTARISAMERGNLIWVAVTGADFMLGFDGFVGTQDGDTLSLDMAYDFGNGLVEMIDKTRPLLYDGTARATVRGRRIDGAYAGRMALYGGSTMFRIFEPAPFDCRANDHRIEFER